MSKYVVEVSRLVRMRKTLELDADDLQEVHTIVADRASYDDEFWAEGWYFRVVDLHERGEVEVDEAVSAPDEFDYLTAAEQHELDLLNQYEAERDDIIISASEIEVR